MCNRDPPAARVQNRNTLLPVLHLEEDVALFEVADELCEAGCVVQLVVVDQASGPMAGRASTPKP